MTDEDIDRLQQQVQSLTTAQLWALVVWLFAEWVRRSDKDLKQYLGKG